jgi:hypothetical protein
MTFPSQFARSDFTSSLLTVIEFVLNSAFGRRLKRLSAFIICFLKYFANKKRGYQNIAWGKRNENCEWGEKQ